MKAYLSEEDGRIGPAKMLFAGALAGKAPPSPTAFVLLHKRNNGLVSSLGAEKYFPDNVTKQTSFARIVKADHKNYKCCCVLSEHAVYACF